MKRKDAHFSAGFSIVKHDLSDLQSHLSLLHKHEHSYLNDLKFDRRKHSYLLGRVSGKLAFQTLVKDQTPSSIFIGHGVFHFPVLKYVKQQNLQICISHCDDIGLSLVYPEEHPMGIDIEKVEDRIIETLEQQLTEKEKQLLRNNQLFTDIGHTMLWTIKEGLSKIFRTGLMMDFKVMEIGSVTVKNGYYESEYRYCGQYKALTKIIGQHVVTIVLPKNTGTDLSIFWEALEGIQS